MIDFSEFDKTTKSEWIEKATADLKSPDLSQLEWKLADVLPAEGYYDSGGSDDFSYVTNFFHSFSPSKWQMFEEIDIQEGKAANSSALQALENGCDGLIFRFSKHQDISLEDLFNDIVLDICTISFTGSISDTQANELTNLLNTKSFNGGFNDLENLNMPGFKSKVIKSESADILESSVEMIREAIDILESDGTPEELAFIVSVSSDFYSEIIRLRSLRMITYLIAGKFNKDISPESIYIHAKPSAAEDYKSALLSNTSAGIASAVAGVNSIDFELQSDKQGDFNKRLSRNTGNILREESKLVFEKDPIAGNYFMDRYTHLFSSQIWSHIQKNS